MQLPIFLYNRVLMSLEFVLLPATHELVLDAKRVAKKIQETSQVPVMVRVDSTFKSKINAKIKKWQEKDVGVIVVTNAPEIHVYFTTQMYPQKISVDEFVDLISSFVPSSSDKTCIDEPPPANSGCVIC